MFFLFAFYIRYNLTTDVSTSQFIDEREQGFFIGRDGDLFLKVTLAEYLTTDSAAGKLLLFNVRTALIAHANSASKKVNQWNFFSF